MLSLAEMCQGVYRVGVEALNTIERAQQGGNISGQVTTAHPAIYPDGTVYNLAVDVRLPLLPIALSHCACCQCRSCADVPAT